MNIDRNTIQQIARDGLWKQNPALIQLLGLCPLLAITQNLINGLVLGALTTWVMICSSSLVAAIRFWIPEYVRIPIFILCIASLVSMIDLVFRAWFFDAYQVFGMFIALITTNCIVLGRVVVFSSKQSILLAAWDALVMGLGLSMILCLMGIVRELFGKGTLFSGAELIFGDQARSWVVTVIPFLAQYPFLYMLLPSGAFMTLGLFIAFKNYVNDTQRS